MEKLTMRIQKQDNLNEVYFEDVEGPGGGRHYYQVVRRCEDETQVLCDVQFQNGPRGEENSIPGVLEGDLLEIVRHRLQCFQKGPFATRDNACALTHIEEALMWLNKRQADRKERGVLGTNNR
jgi:hypothetical protein